MGFMKRYSVSLDVWCPESSSDQLIGLLDMNFYSELRRGDVLYRLESEEADGIDLPDMISAFSSNFIKEKVSSIVLSCEKARAILNIAVYFELDNSTIEIPNGILQIFSGWADISVSFYGCGR